MRPEFSSTTTEREKRRHAESDEPEIAIPAFPSFLRAIAAGRKERT